MIGSVLKSVKGMADSVAHPVKAVQGIAFRLLVKGIVKLVNATLYSEDKAGVAPNHAVLRQLNGLVDKNTNMDGLTKHISFKITLDDIIQAAESLPEEEKSKWMPIAAIKDSVAKVKLDARSSLFELIVKDNINNVKEIVESVNEVLNAPTDLVGCNFVTVSMAVENVDHQAKNLDLNVNLEFQLKAK